jgi:hypothetical protein
MRGFKQWLRCRFDDIMLCFAVAVLCAGTPIIIYSSRHAIKQMMAKEYVPVDKMEKYFDERITRIEQKIDMILEKQ